MKTKFYVCLSRKSLLGGDQFISICSTESSAGGHKLCLFDQLQVYQEDMYKPLLVALNF